MKVAASITLEIVKWIKPPHPFQVMRYRWVVDRAFGWLMHYLRLARDYERRTERHETTIR